MAGDTAIDVAGMTKRFGNLTAVDRIDLRVRTGEICGFLGPNGSGKTTFIRMLCGLLRPDAGSGTCLGSDIIRDSEAVKRQVGYMTQRFSFYEDLSVSENLDFVARVYSLTNRRRAVRETLERMGLADRRDQLAGQLSGGWKQRLALAACLIHDPKLLLLDEPTAGVDPKARRDFWEEIHRLAGQGLTFLITTHYMDEAERCHRLAILDRGALVADDSPQQLMTDIDASVVEVEALDSQQARMALASLPRVQSVTQLGTRLRVLLDRAQPEPGKYVTAGLKAAGVKANARQTNASLEDVFVVVTRARQERAVA